MRIIRRTETIREIADGRWLNTLTGRYHKSATQAAQAVSRRDKAIIRDAPDAAVITILNWEPTTRIGTIIVRALT